MKSSTKMPGVVSILGKAIELKARLNNGDEVIYMWPGRKTKKGNPCHLASNPDGTALYVIPRTKGEKPAPNEKNSKKISRAAKLYENFTDLEIDDPILLSITEPTFKKAGCAIHIVYRSDKWTLKDTDYIHTFKHPPIVHVSGGVKNPKMIALTGGRIRVQPRGIVG